MSNYEAYLGLVYIDGQQDCYSCLKNFVFDNFGLALPNYARPDRFWEDPRLDLYGRFAPHGFRMIEDEHPHLGDVFLMQIRAPMNTHAAMLVANNLILHHPPGQLSRVDPLKPKWLPRANIVLRHPVISEALRPIEVKHHFHEVLPDAQLLRNQDIQGHIERLLAAEAGEVRGDPLRPSGREGQSPPST